jgi:hypothetical protein
VFTKDDDFAEWVRRGRAGPVIVWVRIGNASNPALIEQFERSFAMVLAQLETGRALSNCAEALATFSFVKPRRLPLTFERFRACYETRAPSADRRRFRVRRSDDHEPRP